MGEGKRRRRSMGRPPPPINLAIPRSSLYFVVPPIPLSNIRSIDAVASGLDLPPLPQLLSWL
eukprot:2632926-Pyramimonas_sp.AAC.1